MRRTPRQGRAPIFQVNAPVPAAKVIAAMVIIWLALEIGQLLPFSVEEVFIVFFTAVVLAAAISPAATALERYHVPRGVTVLLVYLGVAMVLGGVGFLIVPLVAGEVQTLSRLLPQYIDQLRGLVAHISPELAQRIFGGSITSRLSSQVGEIAGRLTNVAVMATTIGIDLVVILVMAYFMAAEPDFTERVVTRFAPRRYQVRVHRILTRIGHQMGPWVLAQILLALYFGVMFGVGLKVAGVPYAITLGAIGAILELIPYVGGFITVVLSVLVAATTQNLLLVGIVIGWYSVVAVVEGHLVHPMLSHWLVGLHPLVVVIALFLGAATLGILGALLAIPIALIVQILLDEFYDVGTDKHDEQRHDDRHGKGVPGQPVGRPPSPSVPPADGANGRGKRPAVRPARRPRA